MKVLPSTGLTPTEPCWVTPRTGAQGSAMSVRDETAVFVIFMNYSHFSLFGCHWGCLCFLAYPGRTVFDTTYISICFVVICSHLARPERRLNWDIFSWKMWYPYYYSPTKEAQRGEMSSTYYNGHYNYQHVLCTYYMPGTMLSFYRIKGVILSMGVWRRSRIIHISHFYD